MQSHIVLYRSYDRNPNAADRIVSEATRLLSTIPGIHSFHAARIINTGRAVGSMEYDVMLNVVFLSVEDYELYMSHPKHMEFVHFILKGYVLAGSRASNPEKEFIGHILSGKKPREWARNPAIPDNEVVWGGEKVFDAVS